MTIVAIVLLLVLTFLSKSYIRLVYENEDLELDKLNLTNKLGCSQVNTDLQKNKVLNLREVLLAERRRNEVSERINVELNRIIASDDELLLNYMAEHLEDEVDSE